ncbi:MAG: DUF2800 domain-containing protein [Methylocystaceae bacterium]|nr:DUF2800 domain-containing protein [Methylocystaceae bacterium]
MAHAKLSPSSAERWMTCPGSVVLSDGMPDQTSSFAEEGTKAHEIAEAMLKDNKITCETSAEMLEHISVYVDYVRDVASFDGELHIEQRVKVNDVVFGTADAVVWRPQQEALHIIDLKYGAGVAVEIVNNLQLKIYALATLLTFKYPAKSVTATIVQPRCYHSDGHIRSVVYDVVDLMDFYADVADAIKHVTEATDAYTN